MAANSAINLLKYVNDFLFRWSRLAASLCGEAGLDSNQCRFDTADSDLSMAS